MNDPKIIVAMDVASAEEALALAARLSPEACRLKVGKELFVSAGPGLVSALHDRGFGVFLDLKFHDIPNTVAQACAAAARLGVWMVNVHALGGRRMLEAARDALERAPNRPRLIAVTILTSLAAATTSPTSAWSTRVRRTRLSVWRRSRRRPAWMGSSARHRRRRRCVRNAARDSPS